MLATISTIIGLIKDLFEGISFVRNWFKKKNSKPENIASGDDVFGMAQRFVQIYKSHGVERTQIPRFLGNEFGLTLPDVSTDEKLLHALKENIITKTCDLFGIRREWLDGAELKIYPTHDFYKQTQEFSGFVESLLVNNPDGGIRGVLLAPNERDWQVPALLILQETVGFIGTKPIYRYHLCNNWLFTYWKARAYLTACVAIACKRKVYIKGLYMPKKEIDQLASGNVLLGWQGEGIWELGHKSWYAEDMAIEPEAFLRGIDPELGNYGIKAGLKLWLELEQEGFMDTGIVESARQRFQQEQDKY
ncbi:MAG: hypothetical protein WCV64_06640 [Desulfurivibrionaceae bacterium]|jgi:hypothetical protein